MDDFDINQYVTKTLEPLEVPVFFSSRKEEKLPLVMFNITGERGNGFWDDEEKVTVYKISVNLFAKGNFLSIKNQILKLMKQAGFIRKDVPACIYQEDVEVYNQPIFFEYYKEN